MTETFSTRLRCEAVKNISAGVRRRESGIFTAYFFLSQIVYCEYKIIFFFIYPILVCTPIFPTNSIYGLNGTVCRKPHYLQHIPRHTTGHNRSLFCMLKNFVLLSRFHQNWLRQGKWSDSIGSSQTHSLLRILVYLSKKRSWNKFSHLFAISTLLRFYKLNLNTLVI